MTRSGDWLRSRPWLPRAVGVGWAVYLVSQANIARVLGATAGQVIALQTSPTSGLARGVLDSWDAEDRAAFAAHLPYDLVHPLIYATVLSLSLAWGFRAAQVPRRFNAVLWVPLLAGALDEVENAVHWHMVATSPDFPEWAPLVGCGAAMGKWLIAFSGLAALPVLALVAARKRRQAS